MNARVIPAVPFGAATQVNGRPPPTGSALLSEADWAKTARALRLSGRELQIVRGVFNNLTEHAIAVEAGIADGTVHTHLERLYRKLAVTTRVQLVLRVIENFLHPQRPPPFSNAAFTMNGLPSAATPCCGGCPLNRGLPRFS